MYLIFGTVIVLLIFFFGNTVFSIIKTFATNTNPSVSIGNIWFVGLLIINITIIIFIYTFYYYKSTSIGKDGPTGDKGFTGYIGEPCTIPINNCDFYAPYNTM